MTEIRQRIPTENEEPKDKVTLTKKKKTLDN